MLVEVSESLQPSEPFEFVSGPSVCSYLPGETSSLAYRFFRRRIEAPTYAAALRRGWRRFGTHLFRPACTACRMCRSLRVDVAGFRPSRSQRRTRRANAGVSVEVRAPTITDEHIDLFNRYHADMRERRGWRPNVTTPDDYYDSFLDGDGEYAREFLYRERGRLVGVALTDVLDGASSAAYAYFDPALRSRALGVNSVLAQIEHAQSLGLPYHYLGYWVEGCQSMAYKNQYRPHELLTRYPADDEEPVWLPAEQALDHDADQHLPDDDAEHGR